MSVIKFPLSALFVTALLVFISGCTPQYDSSMPKGSKPGLVWQISKDVLKPESVYFDPASKKLFVSQIRKGSPMEKDDDGWISLISLDGKMIKNKWVTGFSAPKGMRAHKGILWVSDVDRLVAIDIAKAKIKKTIPITGAKFLNDVAIDKHGSVYVSDMMANKIFRYQDEKVTIFEKGVHLESPNGLLVEGDLLIVGTWGSGIQSDFSTKTLGHLMAIDLDTHQRFNITFNGTGHLDGVESDGGKGYLVSDWKAGKVFHIDSSGTTKTLLDLDKGSADIAYIPRLKLLIVPEMLNHKITAYRLN